jgi:hypothetical protein
MSPPVKRDHPIVKHGLTKGKTVSHEIAAWLSDLMAARGYGEDYRRLAADVRISHPTIYAMLKAKSVAKQETINAIAGFFSAPAPRIALIFDEPQERTLSGAVRELVRQLGEAGLLVEDADAMQLDPAAEDQTHPQPESPDARLLRKRREAGR